MPAEALINLCEPSLFSLSLLSFQFEWIEWMKPGKRGGSKQLSFYDFISCKRIQEGWQLRQWELITYSPCPCTLMYSSTCSRACDSAPKSYNSTKEFIKKLALTIGSIQIQHSAELTDSEFEKIFYLDDNAGTTNDLSSLSVLVNLAESSPFPEFLIVVHLQQWDPVLSTEGDHELLVHHFVTVISQHAHHCLTPRKFTIRKLGWVHFWEWDWRRLCRGQFSVIDLT